MKLDLYRAFLDTQRHFTIKPIRAERVYLVSLGTALFLFATQQCSLWMPMSD